MCNTATSIVRFVLITFSAVIFTTFSIGQEYIDIFKSSYSISPNNTFEEEDASTDLHEVSSDLTLPIELNERIAAITGASFNYVQASFTPNQRSSFVSGMALKLGVNQKYNAKWSGMYLVMPKVASDLKRFSKDDLQLGGVALLKYKKSAHFNYKFGIYCNQEHFGTFMVPLFGFYYLSPTERFEAKVMLPLSVDLNYALSSHFKAGMNFKGQIRSYNLNDPILDQAHYISQSTNELTAYIQYEMKNGLNFQAAVGHSVARSFRVYNEGVSFGMPLIYFGDDRQQLNTDFSDGMIFKASVFYRFHFDKKKG